MTGKTRSQGDGPQPDGAEPLRAMVCRTAGSGKTYLINALKQLLGEACMVCAPTGVAADNIGGCTYHSKLPVPRDPRSIDKPVVWLKEDSTRLKVMEADFVGVKYLIIDEMSMVGRRALGQIDELLRQATGIESPFGGLSIILVGDHGQLPPVRAPRLALPLSRSPPASRALRRRLPRATRLWPPPRASRRRLKPPTRSLGATRVPSR